MKKLTALLLCLLLLAALAAGCSKPDSPQDSGKLRIVATIYPEYEWLRAILGSRVSEVELTLLLDRAVDMHSFQPSVGDLVMVSSCDLLVCVGGSSDLWIEDAVREAGNPDMQVVRLLEVLGEDVKGESCLEGMEEEHGAHGHDTEADEHIWLSLRFAKRLCTALTDALCGLDPDNAAAYRENAEHYAGELAELDQAYSDAVGSAARKTLVFADRYPFRYLADDYGLTCYAAFPGCSAETGASFETVAFLAGKVDELELPCVLTLEGSDGELAETVVRSTKTQDQQILTLDSMQSASLSDGEDYLTVMRRNLDVLKQALN